MLSLHFGFAPFRDLRRAVPPFQIHKRRALKRVSRRLALFAWLLSGATGCGTDLEPPVVATVTVTPGVAKLDFLGQSAAFTATVTDQYGDPFAGTVAWASEAPEVFTVSPAGVATAIANGTGALRAQVDAVSGTATVTVNQVPTIVERIDGDAQRGRPRTTLARPLVARVLDAGGNPVAGAAVFFSPSGGSGFVTPGTAPTDTAGEARTSWTLGDSFGSQSLVASVADGTNTVFTATAQRPNELADSVEVVSGDDQFASPGSGLHRPIVVRVLDEEDLPVEGVTVLFDTPHGHGYADPDSVRTDARGEAATTWTLRDKLGLQLLHASVPDGPGARFVATASPGVCERTGQVADALVKATGVSKCEEVADSALSRLLELDLQNMGIATLDEDDFAGLVRLESLSLRENRLDELPVHVFAGLSNLARLDLGVNRLTDLPSDIFANLSDLRTLRLSGNRLSDLPLGVFEELTALQLLYMADNQLQALPPGVFEGLTSLEDLWLGVRQLSISAGLFAGMTNLRSLVLTGSCQHLRDTFAIQFSALSFPVSATPSSAAFPSSTLLTGSGGLIQTSSGSSAALGGPATKRSGRAA